MIFCVLKKGSGAEEGGEKNFTHRAKNHVVVRVFIIFFGENWNVYKIRGAKKCNCHLFCRQNAIPGLCTDQGLHFGGTWEKNCSNPPNAILTEIMFVTDDAI